MKIKKNISEELEKNSINILCSRFDSLLLGLNTKKYMFTSDLQKQKIINSVRDFCKFRTKEKNIRKKSEIWKIILDINNLNFEDISEIKKIYSKLFNLNASTYRSRYYHQKGKETPLGESVSFKKFLENLK